MTEFFFLYSGKSSYVAVLHTVPCRGTPAAIWCIPVPAFLPRRREHTSSNPVNLGQENCYLAPHQTKPFTGDRSSPEGALWGWCAALFLSQPLGRQSPVAHPWAGSGGCSWRDGEERNKAWEIAKDNEKRPLLRSCTFCFHTRAKQQWSCSATYFPFPT